MGEDYMTLPNFLIVGASKGGTTSLYYYLMQHPDIFLSKEVKESYFLCGLTKESYPDVGVKYAINHVSDFTSYRRLFESANNVKRIGEICGAYLYFYDKTILRIEQYLGDVKIIISLRNPVERAYSNYLHHKREGWENLSFEEAITAESERMTQGMWWAFYYVDVGYYYKQVKAYIDAYGKDNVKVFLLDDLRNSPHDVLRDIFSFLSIDTQFIPDMSHHYNFTGIPKSPMIYRFLSRPNLLKTLVRRLLPANNLRNSISANLKRRILTRPDIPPDTYIKLLHIYKDELYRLQSLIDRDLSHWFSEKRLNHEQ